LAERERVTVAGSQTKTWGKKKEEKRGGKGKQRAWEGGEAPKRDRKVTRGAHTISEERIGARRRKRTEEKGRENSPGKKKTRSHGVRLTHQ